MPFTCFSKFLHKLGPKPCISDGWGAPGNTGERDGARKKVRPAEPSYAREGVRAVLYRDKWALYPRRDRTRRRPPFRDGAFCLADGGQNRLNVIKNRRNVCGDKKTCYFCARCTSSANGYCKCANLHNGKGVTVRFCCDILKISQVFKLFVINKATGTSSSCSVTYLYVDAVPEGYNVLLKDMFNTIKKWGYCVARSDEHGQIARAFGMWNGHQFGSTLFIYCVVAW